LGSLKFHNICSLGINEKRGIATCYTPCNYDF
jgi:hypothetical protein